MKRLFGNQSFAQEYSNWETDEVITRELIRNLCIALACVFLTTLILLADILGSVYVLVILLAGSDSHVFSVFFKIFLLVVKFGLFHGLILLPVVLSLIGPATYLNITKPKTKC